MTSKHYMNDRRDRENRIRLIGEGNTIKVAVVDKGHRNGPEIHMLSDTGIITILNHQTGKRITKLIARPGQIRRYYESENRIPAGLLDLAYEHQRLALNH